MGKRILLVWDRLGDYHRARANALRSCEADCEVFTADLGNVDDLYQWDNTSDASHYTLSSKGVDERDLLKRTLRFLKLLFLKRVKVVGLAGYGRLDYIVFIVLARLFGKRVVVFAESWYGVRDIKNRIKALFLQLFVSSLFVSGQRSEDFFRKTLGLRKIKIAKGYSVVDNEHFKNKGSVVRQLIEYPHILCVARFSREKNHERMIDAFLRSEAAKTYHLKLVGSGPMFSVLKKRFSQRSEVIFAPWTSYEDLPNLYLQSEALILPSTFEPWGLVVNEAMAAGLPLLLSKQVGCLPELASEKNSLLFDAYRTQEIRLVFNRYSALSREKKALMRKASFDMVSGLDTVSWSETFLELAHKRRK